MLSQIYFKIWCQIVLSQIYITIWCQIVLCQIYIKIWCQIYTLRLIAYHHPHDQICCLIVLTDMESDIVVSNLHHMWCQIMNGVSDLHHMWCQIMNVVTFGVKLWMVSQTFITCGVGYRYARFTSHAVSLVSSLLYSLILEIALICNIHCLQLPCALQMNIYAINKFVLSKE